MPQNPNVVVALKQVTEELEQIGSNTHPVYISLTNALEATRTRLLSLAELEFEEEIAFAEKTFNVSRRTVDNDYQLGLDDIEQAVAGDIMRRRNELLGILRRLGRAKHIETLEGINLQ